MELEEVFERVGQLGPGQRRCVAAVYLAQASMAFQMCWLVIAGASSEFSCSADGPEDPTAVCGLFDADRCPQPTFSGAWRTLAEEQGLVCGQAYRQSALQSVYMAGVLVGCLFLGVVSDVVGRRRTVWGTAAVIGVTSLGLGWATSYEAVAVLRFVAGVGVAGHNIATYVLGSELIGGAWRTLYVVGSSVSFAVGIVLLAGLASLVSDWRSFSHLIAGVQFLVVTTYLVLPASPRWLLSQGRHEEALHVLQGIGRANGVPAKVLDGLELKRPPVAKAQGSGPGSGQSESLWAIAQHRPLLIWTLIQLYSWFANSAVYYGLTMAAGSLSGSLLVSVALSGLAELPGYAVMLVVQRSVGRKALVVGSMATAGAACLACAWSSPGLSRTTLALVGKAGISVSFSSIYLHSTELFPTAMRTGGLGICSTSARVGGILAPFISLAGQVHPGREFLVFAFVGLSAGALNLLLPETKGRPLPDSVHDLLAAASPLPKKRQKVRDASQAASPLLSRDSSPI